MNKDGGHIVIFDGICGLCHGFVRFVIRHDHKRVFKFSSFQSKKAQTILDQSGISMDEMDTIIYFDGEQVFFKSIAVLNIVRQLSFPANLLLVCIIFPRFIRDFVYDKIAANRYRLFGKKNECELSNGEIQDRFI